MNLATIDLFENYILSFFSKTIRAININTIMEFKQIHYLLFSLYGNIRLLDIGQISFRVTSCVLSVV